MIKIVAKSLIREDQVESFKELVRELVEKSSAEEGNISYSLNVSRDNPRLFSWQGPESQQYVAQATEASNLG